MDRDFDKIIEELGEKAEAILMDDDGIIKLLKGVKEKLDDNEFFASATSDIKLAIEMLIAWKDGEYTDISQNTIILVIAGLLYIVNPLNMLPKLLKKSFLDEALIILYILKKIKSELRAYKKWKEENNYSTEADDRNYIEL